MSTTDSTTIDEPLTDSIESFVDAVTTALADANADDEHLNHVREYGETLVDGVEALATRNEHLREQTVHTVAVERVLLEYEISPDLVDQLIETIEKVDDGLRGGDDE